MWRSLSPEEFCHFHPLVVFLGCVNPDESLGSQFLCEVVSGSPYNQIQGQWLCCHEVKPQRERVELCLIASCDGSIEIH